MICSHILKSTYLGDGPPAPPPAASSVCCALSRGPRTLRVSPCGLAGTAAYRRVWRSRRHRLTDRGVRAAERWRAARGAERTASCPAAGPPARALALVPVPEACPRRRGWREGTPPPQAMEPRALGARRSETRPRAAGSPRWRAEPSGPGLAAGTCRPLRPRRKRWHSFQPIPPRSRRDSAAPFPAARGLRSVTKFSLVFPRGLFSICRTRVLADTRSLLWEITCFAPTHISFPWLLPVGRSGRLNGVLSWTLVSLTESSLILEHWGWKGFCKCKLDKRKTSRRGI